MNTKVLLAGVAAGTVGFFLGWVLFGMLLMGYFTENMTQYDGLMKSDEGMDLVLLFVGNVVFGLLIAWACWHMSAHNITGGIRTGAIIGLGVYTSMALFYLSMWNLYANYTVAVVDVLVNTVWTSAMGLVAGLVLSRFGKAA